MSSFRKVDPTGVKVRTSRLPGKPREIRQNPERWRQALANVIRPVSTTNEATLPDYLRKEGPGKVIETVFPATYEPGIPQTITQPSHHHHPLSMPTKLVMQQPASSNNPFIKASSLFGGVKSQLDPATQESQLLRTGLQLQSKPVIKTSSIFGGPRVQVQREKPPPQQATTGNPFMAPPQATTGNPFTAPPRPSSPVLSRVGTVHNSLFRTSSERRSSPTPEGSGSKIRDHSPSRPGITFLNDGEPDVERQLEELATKPSITAEDRYKILDIKDKIIRKRNPKIRVRVELAAKLEGTCLDMCPEKERYMREVQRRIASYENALYGDFDVDHKLAIKEYSRSSADQEEPLSHELRSISALHLTFDYLLHNIINRVENEEENLADWYFFIWDRTRGIRKDMTQQQLADLDAVTLMEKCTRFHIYCSSRLCELDRHAFDPKLNDENLMKCLQSLDHMYTDLNLKGQKCPNEPEFRAYQILMNLNEGDIIWEIQQKPYWILNSDPVKHAIKLHVALNEKNCSSFFHLVEASTFLTSCILHRYFFQVRTIALRRFLKSFSLKQLVILPTIPMKRMLGFGDGVSSNLFTFKHFCESHGISDVTESTITISNRRDFDQPDQPIVNREHALIDSKLVGSVSEAINGTPLGPNPLPTYVPQSSFDANGYFKRELLDELKLTMKVTPISQLQSQTAPPLSGFIKTTPFSGTPSKSYDLRSRIGDKSTVPFGAGSNQIQYGSQNPSISNTFGSVNQNPFTGTAAASNTFGSFIKPGISLTPPTPNTTAPFGSSNFSFASPDAAFQKAKAEEEKKKVVNEVIETTYAKISNEIVTKELREIATDVREKLLAQAAKEALQRAVVCQIYSQMEIEVSRNLLRDTATIELRKAKDLRAACAEIVAELLESVSSQLIYKICNEIYSKKIAQHKEALKRSTDIVRRIYLRRWFETWKEGVAQRKLDRAEALAKQKWNMENFPPILAAQLSPATILSEWSGFTVRKLDKNLFLESPIALLERTMSMKRSFEKHVEEPDPTISHDHLSKTYLDYDEEEIDSASLCFNFQPPIGTYSSSSKRRKHGAALDRAGISYLNKLSQKQKAKSPDPVNLISDFQTLLNELKAEKTILENSFSELEQSSYFD